MHRFLAPLTLLVALALPALAEAYVPADATWNEQYITEANGTVLHADVLRPKGLAADAKTPVIMTISPYTNHSTQTGTDFDPSKSGPSERFRDFEDNSGVFAKGYTYVIVDLPGFGGSGGCTDWGGPAEQTAVKDAVEWAHSQTWSTGEVGTYGKSYDGWTGLMALAQQPKGLAAVVSAEPVYSGYLYEYMNGVRRGTSAEEGPLFDAINAVPGTSNDSAQYQTNSLPTTPWCYGTNAALQQQDSPDAPFWKVRNLIPAAKGLSTPLFLTQGFLEDNTTPEGAWDLFNELQGPKHAWFGMWDHVRGAEVCTTDPNEASNYCSAANKGKLKMGRPGWFAEVMRFYDQYLKGEAPAVQDPPVVVQTSDGTWRAEQTWPPADSHDYVTTLRSGTYTDSLNDGSGAGSTIEPSGVGLWTISPPLDSAVQMSGVPHLTVDATTALPNVNLAADVYDIDANNKATLISRGAQLIRTSGLQSFDLYGDDWKIAAGHRLGVLVTGENADWWVQAPTQQTVTIATARINLPFLPVPRTATIPGASSLLLPYYKSTQSFTVPAATVTGSQAPFSLPNPVEPTG